MAASRCVEVHWRRCARLLNDNMNPPHASATREVGDERHQRQRGIAEAPDRHRHEPARKSEAREICPRNLPGTSTSEASISTVRLIALVVAS